MEQRPLVRAEFAKVLGVPAENVALTTSTTESCNVVLNGLELARVTRSSRPTASTSA